MSEHINRMKDEHKELTEKINALNHFIYSNKIFKTLSDIEQGRMIKQAGFMEAYANTLNSRIWASIN